MVPLAAVDADLDLFLVPPASYMIMRQNIQSTAAGGGDSVTHPHSHRRRR
jgi:hypothetical protein